MLLNQYDDATTQAVQGSNIANASKKVSDKLSGYPSPRYHQTSPDGERPGEGERKDLEAESWYVNFDYYETWNKISAAFVICENSYFFLTV